ncbi:MAG TPA: tRNA 2-thiouridine(34) synthase MnmA [Thermodesulfobacteriaceae bacterium]|nr:tRNA 2-thiouridine(34) synthase MnmA [Thermodesulfobacteriaceae bacterium]
MIAVAISGGVDSAFAAWLLSRKHEVVLIHALFTPSHPDLERIESLARFLALPYEIVDLREAFRDKVIEYFRRAYTLGLTPNPCVVCNREIKFGLLLRDVLSRGAEKLATGHYVRVVYDEGLARYLLYRGRDRRRDQSYFLHQLSQEALSRVIFPLGDYLKEEVVREAVRIGFFNLTAPESQEVCFIERDYRDLFRDLSFPPGEIVTVDGRVVGRHQGLYAYTVGQRRGLGVRLGKPYYVIRLDPQKNQVIIGEKKDLLRRECLVSNVNFIYPLDPEKPFRAEVRIRYRHKEAPAEVVPLGDGRFKVIFERPQRAITPGQFAVFYRGGLVLGGGEILPEV